MAKAEQEETVVSVVSNRGQNTSTSALSQLKLHQSDFGFQAAENLLNSDSSELEKEVERVHQILTENGHKELGSGSFRTVYDFGDKVIKIPRSKEQMFLEGALQEPESRFTAQYVEEAVSRLRVGKIPVAKTELFHTQAGLPIVVMEKLRPLKTLMDPDDEMSVRILDSYDEVKPLMKFTAVRLCSDSIVPKLPITMKEYQSNPERYEQIAVNSEGELASFDAGDWWDTVSSFTTNGGFSSYLEGSPDLVFSDSAKFLNQLEIPAYLCDYFEDCYQRVDPAVKERANQLKEAV
jgi:hypothetical protein